MSSSIFLYKMGLKNGTNEVDEIKIKRAFVGYFLGGLFSTNNSFRAGMKKIIDDELFLVLEPSGKKHYFDISFELCDYL